MFPARVKDLSHTIKLGPPEIAHVTVQFRDVGVLVSLGLELFTRMPTGTASIVGTAAKAMARGVHVVHPHVDLRQITGWCVANSGGACKMQRLK